MAAEKKFVKFHMKKYELFKSQNPEIGRFDVTFEVEGKNMLNLVSYTFDSMLSDRWNLNKDEPIKIKDYSYDDFYQFITFLYSVQCRLTNSNIYSMIDMAEFYGVDTFKKYCDEFLSTMKITTENICKLLELAEKYLLVQLKVSAHSYILKNFQSFIDSYDFLKSTKTFIKEIVVGVKDKIRPEDLFQAIYKWSEKQAMGKQAVDPNVNLNDAIKAEISDLLPFIQFRKMELKFLIEFIVPRCFVFPSLDVLSKIMSDLHSQQSNHNTKIKITNANGETLHGNLISDENVIAEIKSQNLTTCFFGNYTYCFWNTKCKIPSTPSPVKNKADVEWYLVYFTGGLIGLFNIHYMNEGFRKSCYLLAELTAGTSGFHSAEQCTIDLM